MKQLPPLNMLKAFAQLAETGSVAEAARHLNVTPAAVSQQIRKLEQHLNKALVQKHGRGVLLTEEGQILAKALHEGFRKIRQGVERVERHNRPHTIRITTSPSFASHWLVHKLAEFQALHAGISFQLDLSSAMVPLEQFDFDIAIRFCHLDALPESTTPLMGVSLNVLGAPELLQSFPPALQELATLNWLQEAGTTDAQDWFAGKGGQGNELKRLSEMPGNLIIEALRRGEAVAYTVCDWVQDDIDSGRLLDLWPERSRGVYYALTAPGGVSDETTLFLDWLHGAVKSSGASVT
ncbi:LysR family transcriptional regulator [Leisingera sp. ANG-M1]|uniref:LysR family transcriptional regulator n=1 Tax=Leisingera sp. ANG-M1 TaxID=1577895 RepID=UPI0009E1E23A|nr:LysR family transcriptional regulator [Leisingera sp. ANG-M1]